MFTRSLRTVFPLCLGAFWCIGTVAAMTPAALAQSTDQVITSTQKAVRANAPGVQSELAKLITSLRKSTDMPEQSELIEALRIFGDVRGSSPAAVKVHLKEIVPLALLDFLKSRADGRVRGQALLALRSFDPPDDLIDQAVAIARADTSADRAFVHSQGDILSKWKQDGRPAVAEEKTPIPPEVQKKAAEYLRSRKLDTSYSSLRTAVTKGDARAIEALADSGLTFSGVHTPEAYRYISLGVGTACTDGAKPDQIGEVLKTLQKRGFKLDTSDESGNELVMNTIQECPAPVLARLVDVGARVNPVNKQRMTPLAYAFVAGQWDIAKVLIDRGAAMTKEEADTTFMELPQDPKERDLVNRALQNAGK